MSWFERLLGQTAERMCPLCPLPLEPSVHEGLSGDKSLVPDLSPTCPLNRGNVSPGTRGHAQNPTCPLDLSPVKPAPPLNLGPEGTKGTKGTRPLQPCPSSDPYLEEICKRSDPEEARYLREERAGIQGHLPPLAGSRGPPVGNDALINPDHSHPPRKEMQ